MRHSLNTIHAPPGVAHDSAVEALLDDHGDAVLAYVVRLTGDRSLAEDVLQEVLVRAWRNPNALDAGKGPIRGWILTVARNLVIDQLRARQSRPKEVAEKPQATIMANDPADRIVNTIFVLNALRSLSAKHRDVLEHVYLRDSTLAETARLLDIPVGTAKSRLFQALQLLRKRLHDQEPA